MREVEPTVTIIAETVPNDDAISVYLDGIGAHDYASNHRFDTVEDLVEFCGRMCYRSWQPGLNPNVTRVRASQEGYIENILQSAHGSVLEHVTWTFLLQDISRIVTHELIRHRVGVAVSQESMRYVRMEDIPMWFPSWALENHEFMDRAREFLAMAEEFQGFMGELLGVHEGNFHHKKEMTSFMRRFAPGGHATSMVWTANIRTLRHVIETRTAAGAEEEIRLVFTILARMMIEQHPMLFGDFEEQQDGSYKPKWRKV